jgi:hypothetical protein
VQFNKQNAKPRDFPDHILLTRFPRKFLSLDGIELACMPRKRKSDDDPIGDNGALVEIQVSIGFVMVPIPETLYRNLYSLFSI